MNLAKIPKIDTHVHVGSGNPLMDDGINSTKSDTSPDNLIKLMDKHNIKKSIILAMDIPDSLVPNDYAISLQEKHPDRFIACVCINPMKYKDFGVKEMKKYVGKVKALKLMPPYQYFHINDKKLYPLFRLLENNKILLIVHTGTTDWATAKLEYCRPLEIDTVAVDFPKLRILMAHAGDPWFTETRDILHKNKNVYADISGIVLGSDPSRGVSNLHRFFDEFLPQFPINQLTFGTDWPFTLFEDYEKAINTYSIPRKTKKIIGLEEEAIWHKILHENAEKMLE